jgi:hypothetical protein
LFSDLYESNLCSGIDTKAKEVNDLLRFEGLVSELQFARYFSVVKRWEVSLLGNNAFGERKVPDMEVTSFIRKYYIEVKNIQYDAAEHQFATRIIQLLNDQGRRFMVVLKSLSALATQAFWYQTRKEKERQIQEALIEFKAVLDKIPSSSEKVTISTSIADVELLLTKKEKSFLGITSTEVITEPEDYGPRIVYDIIVKCNKRNDWQNGELETPYLIAIDDPSWMFDEACRYNIELFGKSTYFAGFSPVPDPTIDVNVKDALALGWKNYLLEMHILRNGRSVIEDKDRGKLFTESRLTNFTALLIRHSQAFYLLANPFSDNRINKPDILTEFSDCKTGW